MAVRPTSADGLTPKYLLRVPRTPSISTIDRRRQRQHYRSPYHIAFIRERLACRQFPFLDRVRQRQPLSFHISPHQIPYRRSATFTLTTTTTTEALKRPTTTTTTEVGTKRRDDRPAPRSILAVLNATRIHIVITKEQSKFETFLKNSSRDFVNF
jgi:hypothetical protein